MKKNNGVKLLAAFIIIMMTVCCFAVLSPASNAEVSGEVPDNVESEDQNPADPESDADAAVAAGATVVDTKIVIPEDMELTIYNAMVISESGELVLEEGSAVDLENGKIFVLGKVTDYDEVMYGYELDVFDYEVKKTTETDTQVIDTYTSLRIALGDAVSGDSIQLSKAVTISKNTEIPAGVTVTTADVDDGSVLTVESATLTVSGTLVIAEGDTISLTASGKTPNSVGSIVVNNVIQNADATTFVDSEGSVTPIAGAYFAGTIDDVEGSFVTSASVAAVNSSSTGVITVYGKLSMGDVTFTEGETPLTVTIIGEVNGNVTIEGDNVTFTLDSGEDSVGIFTGSVVYAATAGDVTVDLGKAKGITIKTSSFDDGTDTTNTLTISGELAGTAKVSAGALYIDDSLTVTYTAADDDENVAEDKAVLTVSSGATLYVSDDATLSVDANDASSAYSGLVVDGDLVITDGGLVVAAKGQMKNDARVEINGNMTVSETSLTISGTINVTGTVTVSENYTMNVSKMYVGNNKGASGTLVGAFDLNEIGFIVAYSNADLTDAAIAEKDGTSDADETSYYINGDLYMTSYANGDVKLSMVLPSKITLSGFEDVVLAATSPGKSSWYSNESMTTSVHGDKPVSEVSAVYAKAEVSQASVYVSVGSSMSVFIDDVRYSNGAIVALDVGQHKIAVQVNPGYSGETSVLFNGVAVNGGTFEVTADMSKDYPVGTDLTATECVILSVTGNVSVDVPSTGNGGNSSSDDDGMGLTDILLIVLVVLIAVMAVMVALRLMRS